MSKQLTLSASLAVLSMAAFALSTGFSGPQNSAHGASGQPLIEHSITR
ncbi:MAG: hypothetical protein ACR2FJ_02295 [Qipengyuania sp.]